MGYTVDVDLQTLIELRPRQAKGALLKLLRLHKGQPTKVADEIGVSHATLKRWIVKLDLRDKVEAIRVKAGLPPARTAKRAARGQLVIPDTPEAAETAAI